MLGDLLDAPWPQVDESALQQDEIELVLQINGKLRGAIRVPAGAAQGGDRSRWRWPASWCKSRPMAQRSKRVIVVPGRLVNVVL